MLALYVQTLVLMLIAYLGGAGVAALVRRGFGARTRSQPERPERRVDPLPEMVQAPPIARVARPTPEPAVAAPAAHPTPRAAAAAEQWQRELPAAVADAPAEDLQRIKGIEPDTAAALSRLHIIRYAQIAAFTAQDVRRVEAALGRDGRIGRENWIEQAELLARGVDTEFARRRARGEIAKAAPSQDEGEPGALRAPDAPAAQAMREVVNKPVPGPPDVPVDPQRDQAAGESAPHPAPPPAPAADPDVSSRAAFAGPERVVPRPAAPAAHDDLLRILGLTQELAAQLAREGVQRYSQIAQWSPADVRRLEERLGVPGLIARENWIEQAQILSRGGDTAFSREYDRRSRPAAPTSAPDASGRGAARAANVLGTLRSVRAEAYRNPEPGPQAAQRAAAKDKVLRAARAEDLKRIRGIGVLIEKKLNAMGVLTYDQIANWTAQDIDRVSQSLDFKGRIERENWVEQARILASGGATEFARRVDRGEVESSRVRG